jgi:hypothetical protein
LFIVGAHYWAKAAAERFKERLRAEGEKLSVDELIPVSPTAAGAQNGAMDFLNARASLSSFDYRFQPGAMAMAQPGHARIAWMQAELPTRESSNVWPELRTYVETNAAALVQLQDALQKPLLQFPVNYHQGFSALLPHLAPVKGASQVLSAAALLEMREQRTNEAFANLESLVALPDRCRGSFMIAQLVRYAVLSIAASATWEALQYPHWSDEQLARLQSAWETISLMPDLESSLAMERAIVLDEYAKCRESPNRLDAAAGVGKPAGVLDDLADVGQQIMQDPAEGFEAFADRFLRRWAWKWWNSYEDEIWFLREHRKQLVAARRAARGEPFAALRDEAIAENKRTGEPPGQFLMARLLAEDLYFSWVERAVTTETQRRIVVTAIALKRFERRHGRIPAGLSELTPQFLKALPIDPMDGHPLRFRSTGGRSYLLYSVGIDGKDDGGDARPVKASPTGFFWTRCIDWVWPQPASAEEVREYHEKLGQQRSRKK